ncbi:unnamed protein product [Bursaphelenchus okinawaensis]|uniref:PlsC domain-containing protein n=1 Tax=Bursaphelenchus okinawaensis TaxID=465554 RepID=A0A811LTQ5_9BILA|nr:unnamed protein product [Bursaphelenchus okinawaensis]CAG9127907.1 unnamed protein product [Bursaphelenchus okinawaensis]
MILDPNLTLAENAPQKRMGVKLDKSSSEDSNFTMDQRKIMIMVGAAYWFVMTVLVVPTACLCTLFVVIYPIMGIVWLFGLNKQIVNDVEHWICQLVNDHWVAAGQYTGLTITEHGDDITKISDSRTLFLCNHLGLVDHFCLMTAFLEQAWIGWKVHVGDIQHMEVDAAWSDVDNTRQLLHQRRPNQKRRGPRRV